MEEGCLRALTTRVTRSSCSLIWPALIYPTGLCLLQPGLWVLTHTHTHAPCQHCALLMSPQHTPLMARVTVLQQWSCFIFICFLLVPELLLNFSALFELHVEYKVHPWAPGLCYGPESAVFVWPVCVQAVVRIEFYVVTSSSRNSSRVRRVRTEWRLWALSGNRIVC